LSLDIVDKTLRPMRMNPIIWNEKNLEFDGKKKKEMSQKMN
jgi:hypothetical protein